MGGTNKPKKLNQIFKEYINTFLSLVSLINRPKVINFAVHQQIVNEVKLWDSRRLIIKTYNFNYLR